MENLWVRCRGDHRRCSPGNTSLSWNWALTYCRQCGEKLGLSHDFCPKCGTKNQMNVTARSERRRQRSLPLDSATANLIREFIDQCGHVSRNGKLYLFDINRHRAWQVVVQCAQEVGLDDLRNPETGKVRGISPHRL